MKDDDIDTNGDLSEIKEIMSDLISSQEASKILGLSPITIQKAGKRGDIKCVRIGRKYRFSKKSILKFLKDNLKTD